MRAISLVLLSIAIMALLLTDADAKRRSSAQESQVAGASGSWCAVHPRHGGENCGYTSFDQCWATIGGKAAGADLIRFPGRRMGSATPGQVRSARAAAGSIPIVFTMRRRRHLAFCIGMRETFVTPDHRRPLLECGAVPGAVAA
jgi:hypothetical protein